MLVHLGVLRSPLWCTRTMSTHKRLGIEAGPFNQLSINQPTFLKTLSDWETLHRFYNGSDYESCYLWKRPNEPNSADQSERVLYYRYYLLLLMVDRNFDHFQGGDCGQSRAAEWGRWSALGWFGLPALPLEPWDAELSTTAGLCVHFCSGYVCRKQIKLTNLCD